jgi:hypothetical protein
MFHDRQASPSCACWMRCTIGAKCQPETPIEERNDATSESTIQTGRMRSEMNILPAVRIVFRIVIGAVVFCGPALQTGLVAANSAATSIARIYTDSDGLIHIVHSDGREVMASKEKGQVTSSSAAVSSDKRTAGWLVEFENCCTSYPIPLTLVLYSPGRPIRRLGNGMMICDWHFEGGGNQVGFSTNTVHGDFAPHYELRDTHTGRLIDNWDGRLTDKAPSWTRRLKP